MNTSSRPPAKTKRKPKAKAKSSAPRTRREKSATNLAIATELAPAVALALLDKTDQPAGAAPPSLDVLAAGVAPSETKGKVRVQLMFDNGAVLPVEMSTAAGDALSTALAEELPAKK